MKNNIKKIILAGTLLFSSAIALTGCSEEQKEPKYSCEYPMTEEERNEITPLEKEISELKDFQITDKVYDNKDLEPYNKIQGYLYVVKSGLDSVERIEVIPPKEKHTLEKFGEKYTFKSNVIVPFCFYYFAMDGNWEKLFPNEMEETDIIGYTSTPNEYVYINDESLDKIFGEKEKNEGYQFKLTK